MTTDLKFTIKAYTLTLNDNKKGTTNWKMFPLTQTQKIKPI